MAKKCIICQARDAAFCIKGTNNCYCYRCAVEHFGDVGLLVRLEDDAKKLKEYIDKRINEDIEDENYTAIKKTDDDVLIDIKIKKKELKIKKELEIKKKTAIKRNIVKKKKIQKITNSKKPSAKKKLKKK
jgi:hypothetical protein